MQGIGTKRTGVERRARRVLRLEKLKFKGNVKSLPGSPDLVIPDLGLDICSDDLDADANRAIALGAKRVDAEPMNEVGATWVRMLDPEGNPFCFVLNREK